MTITERIDAITGIRPEYRGTILPAPKSVKIELTARCNFACAFCARSQRLREQKDMDRSLFERLLIEMRAAGVEEIGLFYLGESFLVPWLPEAVRFAKQEAKYPHVFLTTNGSLCAPKKVAQCMYAGLDSLKFSLNYADKDQFEAIARVKPRLFEAIFDNLRAAHGVRETLSRETGHRCGLYASYIAYDGEQGERMQETISRIAPYVDEVYALPLYSQADFVSGAERERGWDVTAGNRGRLDALRDPIPCWAVFTEGHVTWDGKLSACCFDHDGRFHMGDLTRQSFMDAWNSERFQALRAAHLKKDVRGTPCEACVAYA
ncbi:MAG: radical SAM/SPASM domain-containing protein [Kiloniellaceae bacterium]